MNKLESAKKAGYVSLASLASCMGYKGGSTKSLLGRYPKLAAKTDRESFSGRGGFRYIIRREDAIAFLYEHTPVKKQSPQREMFKAVPVAVPTKPRKPERDGIITDSTPAKRGYFGNLAAALLGRL